MWFKQHEQLLRQIYLNPLRIPPQISFVSGPRFKKLPAVLNSSLTSGSTTHQKSSEDLLYWLPNLFTSTREIN